MEFVTISLGNPDLVFPPAAHKRVPFRFSRPVTAVYPLVQSFRFSNTDDDRHIEYVQIRLTPLFNSGVSGTDGEVLIEAQFEGRDFDMVELEISVLVVGVRAVHG